MTHEASGKLLELAVTAADVVCPKCGAMPRKGCRTSTGWSARTHAPRFTAAGLCEDANAREAAGKVFEQERLEQIHALHADTPYNQGYRAAQNGSSGPEFPKGDASWSERLYARGWSDARAHTQSGDQ